MKNTLLSLVLTLIIHSGITAQSSTSYWLNSVPVPGSANTAFGHSALAISTGGNNSATGFNCLRNNLTGDFNVANGYLAMYYNTAGQSNTAVGSQAMISNTTGDRNAAVGYLALSNNTTGNNNISVGCFSMRNNTSGNYNIGVGIDALRNTTTGGNNIGVGYLALSTNIGGTLNNGFGMNANVAASGQTMSTALGGFAICNADYKIRFGANTVTVIEGQVPYSTPSDGRFKNNISETDVKGLDFITRLRPVVYNFDTKKFQEFLTQNMPDSVRGAYLKADFETSTAIRQSGFIAQEVEIAAKQCGYDFNGVHRPGDKNDNYSIAYSQFVVPLVKGMQEQQQMIDAQNREIEDLKKKVNELITTGSSSLPDDFSVYPNPTKGVFTVHTDAERGIIRILNLKGEHIRSINIQNGVSDYQIDLTEHAKGMYIITIQTNNGQFSKKITVQ